MQKLFETTTSLTAFSPAYANVYDNYVGNMRMYELASSEPAVICSPRKTGKTTQGHRIFDLNQRFNKQSDFSLIEIKGDNIQEDELIKLLKTKLGSKEYLAVSLSEIICDSIHSHGEDKYICLNITDSHKFPDDTLRWLLHGIRGLKESKNNPNLNSLERTQIIVEGSFAVDTLTSGPNSEFPMAQLYPREFIEKEQKLFIENRLKKIKLRLVNDTYKLIWELTFGDKYFTQAICERVARNFDKGIISNNEVIDVIDDYLEENPYEDDLKPNLFCSFNKISSFCDYQPYDPIKLIEQIDVNWLTLPMNIKALIYDGGIVRRKGETDVESRAPIVLRLLEKQEVKVRQVKSLIDAMFCLDSVRKDFYDEAKESIDQIIEKSCMSTLKTLHIGVGKKISDNEIEVNAEAYGHGNYTGKWEYRTPKNVMIGEEMWALLWSYENFNGEITGYVRVFPIAL